MRKIASWLLKQLGWRTLTPSGASPRVSIICVAPHTSNWDFLLGKLYYATVGKPSGFLMKKEWFFFPLGSLLRAMGGIPVHRGQRSKTVEKIKSLLSRGEEIHIAITPEGTRSPREQWHHGFYYIALEAGVPIELAKIDYARREVGIFEIFHPTGDIERDLAYIRGCYHSSQAKYPDQFYDYKP